MEVRLHDDQLRTQTFSHLNGLCRMHAKPPCFVAGCRHHTPFGIVPHRYRLATKLRIFSLLYGREKLIHIHMDDLDLRSSLLTLDKVQIILTLFSLNRSLHKLILSLFRFDIDLGYASVFHTLKLAEGSGATETVATRGDAVVIKEV